MTILVRIYLILAWKITTLTRKMTILIIIYLTLARKEIFLVGKILFPTGIQ